MVGPLEVELLLVEDNPGDADLIEAYLESHEFLTARIHHVETLTEARSFMRDADPDLCLLDLTLPDSEGMATLAGVREVAPRTPIILLTGARAPDMAWEAVREGADDFIAKDELGPELLGRAIRYALDRAAIIERLRQQERELAQAQKLEAVGRLAGGIAHDFNNLLTAVSGNAAHLEDLVGDDPEVRSALEEIAGAAERGGRLTNQLLAFSRQKVLERSVVEPGSMAEELEPLLRRLIGEHIALHVHASGDSAPVYIDRSQLEQIVMNLVLNSRDALPGGGRITVEIDAVDVADDPPSMLPEPPSPGRYARIRVRDDGYGMDVETQSHVFEPFFTTKDPDEGTGLGLATVYGTVEELGGRVGIESTPGEGTEVTVLLPVTDQPVEAPVEASEEETKSGQGETVLVVEDEDAVRRVAVRTLESAGYTVVEARDGTEALRRVDEGSGNIDLLLTDVVMPKMSGTDLAVRLRERLPGLRVVLTSGYTQDELVQQGVDQEDIAFLPKPYSPRDLQSKVATALRA